MQQQQHEHQHQPRQHVISLSRSYPRCHAPMSSNSSRSHGPTCALSAAAVASIRPKTCISVPAILLLFASFLAFVCNTAAASPAPAARVPPHMYCRDPDLGGQLPAEHRHEHRYLLITGGGAGIGNFLIFYPAAFYFALLSGRDILVMDDSLIGKPGPHPAVSTVSAVAGRSSE
jgi:hypothetical protein